MAVSLSVQGQTNLIQDGSFESPVITSNTYQWGIIPDDWTVGNPGDSIVFNGTNGIGFPTAEDGQQYFDIGGAASISQAFTISTPGEYQLTWYYYNFGTDSFSISNSSSQAVTSGVLGSSYSSPPWQEETLLLNLNADVYTLSFAGGGGLDSLIDNVSLVQGGG